MLTLLCTKSKINIENVSIFQARDWHQVASHLFGKRLVLSDTSGKLAGTELVNDVSEP